MMRSAKRDLAICQADYLSVGPWKDDHWHERGGKPRTIVRDADGEVVAELWNLDNAALAALARTALPYWIKRAQRLKAENDRLKQR
jgi:hypothetical protein